MAFRKLTPDVKDRVLQALRLGATYEHACAYAGIDRRTLLRYRKDGAFVAEVEKAQGAAVIGWLARIEKAAADGEWTAAAWKLERRYPEIYGRKAPKEVHVTLDLEARVRALAVSVGLDPEAALAEAQSILALTAPD